MDFFLKNFYIRSESCDFCLSVPLLDGKVDHFLLYLKNFGLYDLSRFKDFLKGLIFIFCGLKVEASGCEVCVGDVLGHERGGFYTLAR